MIVVCEGCTRRFQVDDARIPARGARVRCKRCNHRFHVMPSAAGTGSAAPAAPDETGDQTLLGITLSPQAGDAAAELRFVTEPPADGPAEPDPPTAGSPARDDPEATTPSPDATVGEGSWEFGDSSLSFDEAMSSETPEESAASTWAETSQSFMDGIPDEAYDARPVEEATAPPAGGEREAPLRAVVPAEDDDSAVFEMADDGPSQPLELADPPAPEVREAATEEPGMATSPSADLVPEPETASEPASEPDLPDLITTAGTAGSDRAADEGLAVEVFAQAAVESSEPHGADAEPHGAAAEPHEADAEPHEADAEPHEADAEPRGASEADSAAPFDFSDDPELDWLEAEGTAEPAQGPPAPRAAGSSWLEHVGWALSVVLLLAVAQGTVEIEPRAPAVPPGQIAIAGLSAQNVRGRFVENARSGALFVVSGELHNPGSAPLRAGRALRVVLLDAQGQALATKHAAVGPELPEVAVREMPIGPLVERQERAAAELAHRDIAPGGRIAFDAVMAELPEEAVRFRIEAGGPPIAGREG